MNLFNYNLWSGSDYLNNCTDFNKIYNLISSIEWASNGNKSIKFTRTSNNYSDYTTEHMFNLPTGNYLFSCDVFSPEANGRIYLFLEEPETVSINFSASEDVQRVSLSVTNHLIRGFRLVNDSLNKSIYYDNFKIVHQ